MHSSRRDFLRTALGAGVLAGVGTAIPARAARRAATDWVPLGKSGVRVTRLALGTGTHSGRIQRELGQEQFTRMVRHAYDRGIRFFETADSYPGIPEMLATALKGIPRDTYRLMTKYNPQFLDGARDRIDAYRKQLNTDYFDILLLHCVRSPQWPSELQKLEDAFSEAKSRQAILAHGASVHGLPALRAFPGTRWLDIAMIRMNHKGVIMDSEPGAGGNQLGDVNEVVAHTRKMQAQGAGVISMKLVGEGRFTQPEDREASLKFAMNLGSVDAVTIGFKSIAEVDEAIERMNRVMNES